MALRPGSWASIGLIYFFGVLGPASLGKVVPMQADFIAHLGATPQLFGLFVSVLMLPAAVLGAAAGWLGDRIGPGRMLTASACIAGLTNVGYCVADTLPAFFVLRLVEGAGMVCVFTSAPALIMATTEGARRTRAMSLWTTYTPVGFSLGLALVVPFVGGPHWKQAYAVHAVLFFATALAGAALPKVAPPSQATGGRWASMLAAYRQPGPLRLALAFGAVVFMGFGVSSVFPAHFAAAHQLPLATATTTLAVCNLAMVAGSVLTGVLRVRGFAPASLMLAFLGVGVLAGVLIFAPGLPVAAAVLGVVMWLLCGGASMAVLLTLLPEVVQHPRQGASAAGLLSQVSAVTTFITAPVWLPTEAAGLWWLLCLFMLAGAALAWRLMPTARPAPGVPVGAP